MASIPELTRLLAAIRTWQDGHGQPQPPADWALPGIFILRKRMFARRHVSYGAGGRVRAAPPWPLRGWGGLGASPGLVRHAALSRAKHRQATVMRLQQRFAKSLAVQRRHLTWPDVPPAWHWRQVSQPMHRVAPRAKCAPGQLPSGSCGRERFSTARSAIMPGCYTNRPNHRPSRSGSCLAERRSASLGCRRQSSDPFQRAHARRRARALPGSAQSPETEVP